MNYTQKEASKIRVGDTLTLEDGSKHKAIPQENCCMCIECSIDDYCGSTIKGIKCGDENKMFHFKHIKP